jgi:hypothetical protein
MRAITDWPEGAIPPQALYDPIAGSGVFDADWCTWLAWGGERGVTQAAVDPTWQMRLWLFHPETGAEMGTQVVNAYRMWAALLACGTGCVPGVHAHTRDAARQLTQLNNPDVWKSAGSIDSATADQILQVVAYSRVRFGL